MRPEKLWVVPCMKSCHPLWVGGVSGVGDWDLPYINSRSESPPCTLGPGGKLIENEAPVCSCLCTFCAVHVWPGWLLSLRQNRGPQSHPSAAARVSLGTFLTSPGRCYKECLGCLSCLFHFACAPKVNVVNDSSCNNFLTGVILQLSHWIPLFACTCLHFTVIYLWFLCPCRKLQINNEYAIHIC